MFFLVFDSSTVAAERSLEKGRATVQSLDNPEIRTEGRTFLVRGPYQWQRTSENPRALHGLPIERRALP